MNISLSSFRHCMYQNTHVQSSGLYDSYMYAGVPSKQAYYKYWLVIKCNISTYCYQKSIMRDNQMR